MRGDTIVDCLLSSLASASVSSSLIEHITGRWVRLPKGVSPPSATGKVRLMFAPGQ
jgi:hypothetical protein